MMKFFLILPSLIACVSLISLAVYIYSKNPFNLLNKVYLLFLIFAAVWTLSETFTDSTDSPELAVMWLKIGALCWVLMGPVFLTFALILTKRGKLVSHLWFLGVLYLPAFVFEYLLWKTRYILTFQVYKTGFVWEAPLGDYFWAFMIWILLIFIFSMGVLFHFGRTTSIVQEKKQVQFVILSILVPFAPIFFIAMLLPMLGVNDVPLLALIEQIVLPLTALSVAGLVGYAVVKYKLFIISPETAMVSIVSTMNEALIVFNPEGFIEIVNRATSELLGYEEKELTGVPLKKLFLEGDSWDHFEDESLSLLRQGKSVKDFETALLAKDGSLIDVTISGSSMMGKDNHPTGMVIVLNDIRDYKALLGKIKKTSEELQVNKQRLEQKLGGAPF